MKRRVTRRGAGAAIVASLLMLPPVRGRARETEVAGRPASSHLTPRSTLRDLLNHPAFAGFGALLLPWAYEPPTFVVVGERDGIAPPSIMERRVAALRRSGTDVEYRTYPDLGHGFGPGAGTSAEGRIGDATRFWERFIRKKN